MKNNKWESVYIEYAKNNKNPQYDYRLWEWLKKNYSPPSKKQKNEKKTKKIPTNVERID